MIPHIWFSNTFGKILINLMVKNYISVPETDVSVIPVDNNE